MAEVYYVSHEHTFAPYSISAAATRHLLTLTALLKLLFKKGNAEQDPRCTTVVVLPDPASAPPPAATPVDALLHDDKVLLLRYFFSHLNIIVVSTADLASPRAVAELNDAVAQINDLVCNRISRVATWTGTGTNVNDFYSHHDSLASDVHLRIVDVVPTMSFVVDHSSNLSRATELQIIALKGAIVDSVDFMLLLENTTASHLQKLCHCVGHWAFPAHELSNDDLVYCVYLMLSFSLHAVEASKTCPPGLHLPTRNDLLALVYMTRDTYKNGNPFHNFRHAVDVCQACFVYLIRLGCLPKFAQLAGDPHADEQRVLDGKIEPVQSTGLVARPEPGHPALPPLLNPLQTLGLLVAALGHDVGHPGVTNAFMIKHSAPTSQLYGERSVLELYHASVFVNKILSINWPSLLTAQTTPSGELTLKQLIIGSILATDMAEHFEYIHKLKEFEPSAEPGAEPDIETVKLIASLVIKCADISNVTRPVRISAQWALVLSREFEEVEVLEKSITAEKGEYGDMGYPKLPRTLLGVLEGNPTIQKGQIFFIQTFAEGLFNKILQTFPEFQYTLDIIGKNKEYWLKRAEKY